MNKKIFVCVLSLFSMTLFCAEEHVEMEISRKRCPPKDWQVENQTKRRITKKQHQNDDMQISKNYSCKALMEERDSIAQVNEALKQLEEKLEGSRKEFNLPFLTDGEVIEWLETNGQEKKADELKGAINFFQDRKMELMSELFAKCGLD